MTGFVDRHRSDFNYNNSGLLGSFGDILWRDHAGDNVLWLMGNDTPFAVAALPFVTPDWHFKAAADFNEIGFGNADILWQNDNGALAIWQVDELEVTAIRALPNPGPTWHVVGDNDFSGGERDNILFQNDNGALAIWADINPATGTVGAMLAGTQNPGPTWHVVGTGDTSGTFNSPAGILWQNNNGALVMWEDATFGPGTFTFNSVAALPSVDASWHVKGMADVSGDERADIVFQHDSGAVVVWLMGGTTVATTQLVNINPGPAWHIVGLRDMNADGKTDILFQNDNGAAAIWEDYLSLGVGSATFARVLAITPNPNPNGHVWDLL